MTLSPVETYIAWTLWLAAFCGIIAILTLALVNYQAREIEFYKNEYLHLKDIHQATIEVCGEPWLKAPVSKRELGIIKGGNKK